MRPRRRRWGRLLVGTALLTSVLTAAAAHAGPAGPRPYQPVPAGNYVYATSGRFDYGQIDSYPATSQMRFGRPHRGVQSWHWDQRDTLGNGTVDDQEITYRPDGVYLVNWNESYTDPTSYTPVTGTYVYDCRPGRPQLIIPSRDRVGERFTYTLPCTGYTETFTVTVEPPQTATVGKQRIPAEVLRQDAAWSSGGDSGSGTTYLWMLPGTDLMLEEKANYDEQYNGVPDYSQYETAQLESLQPQ